MAQTGFTPIQLYYSTTPSSTPTAGNLVPGELAINTADGKLFYEDSGGVVQVIATKAGASGDVVGPASATDGNLAAFDGTTGKLIKQAATVTTAQGGTGLTSFTANRVFYASSTSTIGQSANLTFDGTTLTANSLTVTNNPTFSAGTANGVLYLNGSKVATSGSALTFDGTSLNVGSTLSYGFLNIGNGGTTNYATVLTLNGTNNAANGTAIVGRRNGTNAWLIGDTAASLGSGTGFTSYNYGSNPWIWYLQDTGETMRLTSTGLGIGTSSPAGRVDSVANATAAYAARSSTTGANQTVNALTALNADGSLYALAKYNAIQHIWGYSGTTEGMRLDASGNLGIGTSSPVGKLDVRGATYVDTDYAYFRANNALQRLRIGTDGVNDIYLPGTAPLTISGQAGIAFSTDFTERMRLDASGNLGIGTSSPVSKLQVNNGYIVAGTAASTTGIKILGGQYTSGNLATFGGEYANGGPVIGYGVWPSTSAAGAFVSATTVNVARGAYTIVGNQHLWYSGDQQTVAVDSAVTTSERMRLDSSGNLGIGTTSPSSRLSVVSAGTALAQFTGAQYSQIRHSDGTRTLYTQVYDNLGLLATESNTPLAFGTNNGEKMRLDTSGNLGLGTTPSAWSGQNAFQIGDAASVPLAYIASDAAGSTVTNIGHGAYWNGSNWLYTASSIGATRYQMTGANAGSTHAWFVSAGGTAGNAISFTQAMTLDASANLTIAGTYAQAASWRVTNNGIISSYTANSAGALIITDSAAPIQFATNNIERARITSGGDLLVGTTTGNGRITVLAPASGASSYALLDTSNTGTAYAELKSTGTTYGYIGSGAALVSTGASTQLALRSESALLFSVGTTETARITGNGALVVGNTAAAGSESVCASNNSATTAPFTSWNRATSGDNFFAGWFTEGTATIRGSIDYNRAGGLVRYNTTSDYRAKDIIGPVQNPGATIDALKVYEGVMKGATQSRPMLIAHEAQEHAPYAVSGVKDEVNEDGTPKFQQIDVSSLVPLLLAEIQSLRARVAALESQP